MSRLRAAMARLMGMLTRGTNDDDLRAELQSHLEMETAEYVRRGMSPDAARRKALVASGGLTLAAEAVRAQRGVPWLENLAGDIRYAIRSLLRSPAFTTVVVVTLALGIGPNTAIFSVIRPVLLKPLPHADGDRLVYLRHSTEGTGETDEILFSVPEINDLRRGVSSLAGIAEFAPWTHTMQLDGDAERIDVGLVTGNYFEVMGLGPVLGRLTKASDDGAGVPPVMVLTHEFWTRRFRGDSSIVGSQLTLHGIPVTVIGVLEPAPFFPDRVDALLNMVVSQHHLSAQMTKDRVHRMTGVVARLSPAASIDDAREGVRAVHARMQRAHVEAYDPGVEYRVAVIPFKEVMGERAQLTIWLLAGAAALVMIISAASVTNLTLMRRVRRDHELVVRAALGAGARRMRRLLLVENLVLTTMGAALGVVIAIGSVRLLTSLVARYSPRAGEIRLDTAVLGFTLALAVVVALLLSFAASLPREGSFASWISLGGPRMTGGAGTHRLQRALVVAQVAVSFVLLVGAGLLTRTMIELSGVDTGLAAREVLTMPVPLLNPSAISTANDSANKNAYDRMRSEIEALPGVIDVGLGSTMPLRRTGLSFEVQPEGTTQATENAVPHAEYRTASPQYFRAAGIPLIDGREFRATDATGAERVAIVNEAFAQRFFAERSALQRRIRLSGNVLRFLPVDTGWRTIVGVVGNTLDGGLETDAAPVAFMPFAQEFALLGGLVINTDSNAAALVPAVTRIVRRIAPETPLEDVLTIAQIKDQSVSPRRLNAALISLFGVLAVIIAAVGIAGVLAFAVSARTAELGIRMSLGASSGQVQRMILKEGGVLLATGLMLGATLAYFAARSIRGLLFGVTPHDPLTFAGVALLITAIGLGASWIPARRAARIDPATAMRA